MARNKKKSSDLGSSSRPHIDEPNVVFGEFNLTTEEICALVICLHHVHLSDLSDFTPKFRKKLKSAYLKFLPHFDMIEGMVQLDKQKSN